MKKLLIVTAIFSALSLTMFSAARAADNDQVNIGPVVGGVPVYTIGQANNAPYCAYGYNARYYGYTPCYGSYAGYDFPGPPVFRGACSFVIGNAVVIDQWGRRLDVRCPDEGKF